MTLLVCDDCKHHVSHLALACPSCGRPMRSPEPLRSERPETRGARPTAAVVPLGDGAPIAANRNVEPVLREDWLADLRRAKEPAAEFKVCRRCGTNVAVDGFRRRSGTGYLCADCILEGDERRRVRLGIASSMVVTVAILALAGGLTATAVTVLPMLQVSRGAKTAK